MPGGVDSADVMIGSFEYGCYADSCLSPGLFSFSFSAGRKNPRGLHPRTGSAGSVILLRQPVNIEDMAALVMPLICGNNVLVGGRLEHLRIWLSTAEIKVFPPILCPMMLSGAIKPPVRPDRGARLLYYLSCITCLELIQMRSLH